MPNISIERNILIYYLCHWVTITHSSPHDTNILAFIRNRFSPQQYQHHGLNNGAVENVVSPQHHHFHGHQHMQMNMLTIEPPKELLSVSGKKKCSYCDEELGTGRWTNTIVLILFFFCFLALLTLNNFGINCEKEASDNPLFFKSRARSNCVFKSRARLLFWIPFNLFRILLIPWTFDYFHGIFHYKNTKIHSTNFGQMTHSRSMPLPWQTINHFSLIK